MSSNDCECTIGTHISRAFMCQILLADPTPKEASTLNEKGIALDALRSYYVWRRSSLLFSIPFIFVGMIFGFIDLVVQLSDDDNQAVFNVFGKLLIFVQNIDSFFLLVGVIAAFVWWNQLTKSVIVVRIAFLLSFVMPLIPALFPLEMSLNSTTKEALDDDGAEQQIFSIKVFLSLQYMLTLLPVIISFPGGVLRAALRIRWLLPESMLSGWILLMSAPFYSILLCIALIVALQVAGNFLLFLGTLFVVAAPWVYVVRGSFFVHIWTEEKKKQVLLAQQISGIATLVGYFLIIIFAFTGKVSGVGFVGSSASTDTAYLLSYVKAFRILVETLGRLFITTLMFSDAILRMNLENWQDFETSKLKGEDEMKERYLIFIDAFVPVDNGKDKDSGAESNDSSKTTSVKAGDRDGTQSPDEENVP